MVRRSEPVAWLSLVDVSGPFLAGTVLDEAFPQGLDKIETPRRQRLRAAYEEWQDAVDEGDSDLEALHEAWVRMVVTDALEYDDEILTDGDRLPPEIAYRSPEHGVELRADLVVRNGDGATKLLLSFYPPGTSLDNPLPDRQWPISPAERMTLLCRATDCRIGLISNGERWMLVNAPVGETSGYVSWYARLWWQEPVTLKAFQSLLGVRRCFGPEEESLPRLLERSLEFQEEVTNTLGEQVRRAVEVLIQSLGRADQDRNGELLKDVEPAQLYEAGLTVMMRLVFILCAEERGLLLLNDPVYDQHYAVSTLRAKLREDADQHGEEVLEKRQDAWSRLLSVFRIIYGGVEHDALRLPALGGSLFDPDRFPFLEGRLHGTTWRDTPAVPLPIDNRTVLLLMTALQVLEQRSGAQLLSYRALDVEQIGHVYEGLLEFTAARVPEVTLGLIGTKKSPNPQIALSELESLSAKGEVPLVDRLNEFTGRSQAALRRAMSGETEAESLPKLTLACHGDERLARRLLPFGELIRSDSWGNLLVYQKGSFAIVKGTDRRSSGTHYTPRSLTEPIIRYTLEPLVYVGPAEGHPPEEWKLKSSADILALKVCDMACGSGAFLVEACRYLSQRLVEAWGIEEAAGLIVGVDGVSRATSDGREPLPKNLDDRLLIARRLIAQSCLYGVDINHLAVELAKLSIWLVTLAKNKPFSFLDHVLRCGDSLIGLHDLEQLRFYSLKPDAEHPVLFKGPLNTAVDDAIGLRLRLEGLPANTVADIEAQERLLTKAEDKVARLKCAADLLASAEFRGEGTADKQERIRHAAVKSGYYVEKGPTEEFRQVAAKERQGKKMFHWPLEFPEVIVKKGGFDAFVSNPPFIGNKFWGERLADGFTSWASVLLGGKVGKIDYAVLFLRRAFSLAATQGHCGFISTRAVHEGESRSVGLSVIASEGMIYRAQTQLAWPGTAGVHVSLVWFARHRSSIHPFLDGSTVDAISSELSSGEMEDVTYELKQSLEAFQGSHNGKGEALTLTQKDEWYAKLKEAGSPFLRQFVTSDDITSSGMSLLPRWIVDTEDLPLDDVKRRCPTTWTFLTTVAKPARTAAVLKPYKGLIDRWWQLWNHRAPLYRKIRQRDRCMVLPFVAKHAFVAEAPTEWVFTNKLCVVERESDTLHATLLTNLFEAWIRRHGGTMGKTRMTLSLVSGVLSFPILKIRVPVAAELISEWRRCFCKMEEAYGEAYTSVWNAVHDMEDRSDAVIAIRNVRSNIDRVIADAYGFMDIDLTCDFIERNEGVRFTISEAARREVLQRLLKLNHERYEEEVRQGLHSKKKASTRRKATEEDQQESLPFDAGKGA